MTFNFFKKNIFSIIFLFIVFITATIFIYNSKISYSAENNCCYHECNIGTSKCVYNVAFKCCPDCDSDIYQDWCAPDCINPDGQDCTLSGQTCVDGVCTGSCISVLTCSDYPNKCGNNLSNGCANILDCSANCSLPEVCSSGSCICPDSDGDGYRDQLCGGDDCQDTGVSANQRYPGNTEICDGLDNDCDGQTDENCSSKKSTDIFLIIGQSNSVGRGAELPMIESVANSFEIDFINGTNNFIPLSYPTGRGSGLDDSSKYWSKDYGFSLALAKQWNTLSGNDSVFIFAGAGGSSLVEYPDFGFGDWTDIDDNDGLYDFAINSVNNAITVIDNMAEKEVGKIIVVWHQGETDALINVIESEYIAHMEQFYNRLYEDIAFDAFFVATIGFTKDNPEINNLKFNNIIYAQEIFANSMERSVLTSRKAKTLTCACASDINSPDCGLTDLYHYKTNVYEAIGKDIAINGWDFVSTGNRNLETLDDSSCSPGNCEDECLMGDFGCDGLNNEWTCGETVDGDNCLDKVTVACGVGENCSTTSGKCDCVEERVDYSQDGTFSICGCSSDYSDNKNGFICDINRDLIGDGICVGDECVTSGSISMMCYSEECKPSPHSRIYKGCDREGIACDNDYVSDGQIFFEQDGVCANVDGINACVSIGYACNKGVCQQVTTPSAFDWRDHNGENWMTSVKNQGMCGSCWAFTIAATIEAKYNIQENNPNLDIDLSEQYLVSNCSSSGDCGGGWPSNFDLTDEDCYPYQAKNSICGDRCSDWSSRLWSSDYFSLPTVTDYVEQQKLALITQGPIYVGMNMNYVWDIANGYYKCSDTARNHAVTLVGWNDIGGYWIIKNSWGLGWGESGYGKIGYNECGLKANGYQSKIIAP